MNAEKRILVVGAGGFAGGYLLRELLGRIPGNQEQKGGGNEIHATLMEGERLSPELTENKRLTVHRLDITDAEAVFSLMEEVRPHCVYHLAALSSAALSWKKPALTVRINVEGAVNLLEAVRTAPARVLLIGSGEEYGKALPEEMPLREDHPLRPQNPYAVTKMAQNHLGRLYASAYGLEIISVRAFNHIGPGQAPQFVASDFCRQTARIEKGMQEPVISVGNLSAVRDFTDVRDVARAYRLLMERGISGKTYNVGGGTVCSIQELLDRILALSPASVSVEKDPSRFRPVDAPKICADISEIRRDTGWEPYIPLDTTLRETLDYWRNAECG